MSSNRSVSARHTATILAVVAMTAGIVAAALSVGPVGSQGRRAPGLYALVRTSEGDFRFRLLEKQAPKTVANFVGLAEGTIDPATGKPGAGRPFYDGLTFHRVVKAFIIQGGDPKGDGSGGPGYSIADEIDATRRFDRPGVVAMASHGPNRNGSQFFVTLAATPSLDGKFTIFAEVVEGMDTVTKIANGRTLMLPSDRLAVPVRIESVRIERVAE